MALIFIKIGLKLSYLLFLPKKKNFFLSAGGSDPHTLCLRWLGDPLPDLTTPPPIADFWLRACMKKKITARYCRPPFVLAFGFKYTWNVWQRRCSHSQTVYNTAKSISPGNTYTEKSSQKILSSAPIPLWLWLR